MPESKPSKDIMGKVAIVTGGANGIGSETVRLLHDKGAYVVIADLPFSKPAADQLVSSLSDSRAVFVPTDILVWRDVVGLFDTAIQRFGRVDIVVANAGIMESKEFYDLETDADGKLKEPLEAYRVIDVNLKGTMNTLRLAMHHMRSNPTSDSSRHRGSIVLIASTSGYFGGTGVVSYIASKHGVVGLLRSSQKAATKFGIRLNAIAPFFTPTHITGSYAQEWKKRGLPANRVEDVASAIVNVATDEGLAGNCMMVAGRTLREVESSRANLVPSWIGTDIANLMAEGGRFFDQMGGYPLPKPRI